jgi:hypothetical protein
MWAIDNTQGCVLQIVIEASIEIETWVAAVRPDEILIEYQPELGVVAVLIAWNWLGEMLDLVEWGLRERNRGYVLSWHTGNPFEEALGSTIKNAVTFRIWADDFLEHLFRAQSTLLVILC